MILGLGFDIVSVDRMRNSWERFGLKIARRILHPDELAALPGQPATFLASRFAAKEAAVKALGTGFAGGILPQDFLVRNNPTGKPYLLMSGKAAERFVQLGGSCIHLSISHERDTAGAVVVLEA